MPALPKLFRAPPTEDVAAVSRRLDQFADKYQAFFPRVFAYVYGRVQNVHVAEDLVSEIFERAFLKEHSLRNDEAFATWLFTIARNLLASHGRRRGRETIVDPEIFRAVATGGPSVESQVLLREEVAAVADCLKKFPQREQDIIALKFDAELANGQIARIMGLSEANVRVILFRTLRKLRELMAARPGARD